MTEYRYQVHTPDPRGLPSPYRFIRAVAGKSFNDRNFDSTDTALRGSVVTMSVGILVAKKEHGDALGGFGAPYAGDLMGCDDGTNGWRIGRKIFDGRTQPQSNYLFASRRSASALVSNNAEAFESRSRAYSKDPTGADRYLSAAFASTHHPNTSGALELVTAVFDNGAYSVEHFNINGRAHEGNPSAARFVCVAGSLMADSDFVSLNNLGIHNAPLEIEFDVTGNGVTPGRVAIPVLGTETATQMASKLAAAINANTDGALAQSDGTANCFVWGRLETSTGWSVTESVADAGFLLDTQSDGGFRSWSAQAAVSSTNFRLGLSALANHTKDYIAGMFFHEDALTENEIWHLRQEIQLAKDIPLIPRLPGSPTLDHVWSAKQRFTPGLLTGQTAGGWVSQGALGGKTLTVAGGGTDADLEAVDIDASFALSR